ncbi:MAG: HAD-IIIA family hydrolase [Proteobacteria bacterium]|nr:HAD-IIIA family hydrolase [Pseudomonadota bacterium]
MDEGLKKNIAPVKLLILDVDGVMTDGRIVIDSSGVESKSFHVRDGHGIKLLIRAGIDVAIISGRYSGAVEYCARELGIKSVFQGAKNKMSVYETLIADMGLKDEEVAFVGDDVVDLPVLRRVGFSASVADASNLVTSAVDCVTLSRGGRGAVRELVELILQGTGNWDKVMSRYF